MRAMLLEQIGQPLQLRELPVPQPGPGEVRVRSTYESTPSKRLQMNE